MTNTSPSSQGRSVSIWMAIGITFVVALVSYALGSMLINSFSQIRKFIIPIFVAIGLLASRTETGIATGNFSQFCLVFRPAILF